MKKLLSIDPSIHNLGYAHFYIFGKYKIYDTYNIQSDIKLAGSGVLHNYRSKELSWIQLMDYMIYKVSDMVVKHSIDTVVIEEPEIFLSSRGSASLNSGSLGKLFSFVFSLRQALISGNILSCDNIHLVKVSEWKGQTPKEVTMKRNRKRWSWQGTDHNESDAIGIGTYYIEQFNAKRIIHAQA